MVRHPAKTEDHAAMLEGSVWEPKPRPNGADIGLQNVADHLPDLVSRSAGRALRCDAE